MLATVRTLFLATRPMFLTASLLPVLVGTAWARHGAHAFDPLALLLALAGMACLHSGANVLNDVGDELNGCDRDNPDRIGPFTGGSRAIQDGRVSLSAMRRLGAGLLAAGAASGLALIALKGLPVLWFGLLGGALGIAYSLPPFLLASRGLGELAVFIAFGTPVVASAWLQGAAIDDGLLTAAAAVGAWSAAILIANEVPDVGADARAGKRTLVVRLGSRAPLLYLAVQAGGALLLMYCTWPSGLAMAPVILGLALAAVKWLTCGCRSLLAAIRTTLVIHLLGCLWLAAVALLAPLA